MEIFHPPPGGCVSGPSSKQNIMGNANGLPKIQMASAHHSMMGLMASSPSAIFPKHAFRPQPLVQQSQQTFCTQLQSALPGFWKRRRSWCAMSLSAGAVGSRVGGLPASKGCQMATQRCQLYDIRAPRSIGDAGQCFDQYMVTPDERNGLRKGDPSDPHPHSQDRIVTPSFRRGLALVTGS